MFIHITTSILHYIKHYTAKSICMWGDQVWGEVSIGLGGAECLEAVTSRATPPLRPVVASNLLGALQKSIFKSQHPSKCP